VTPETLASELAAGRVRGAYLVAGPEPLLRDEAIAALRRSVLGDAPADFNFDRFEGDATSAGALHDALRMLPVFAARRLVWLREPNGGRGAWKAILEALPELVKAQQSADTSVLVVSAGAVDRRLAWVRAFGDALVACEAPRNARELAAFVKAEAARRELRIGAGVAEALVERVGPSLLGLRNELEKVSLLAGPGAAVEKRHVLDSAADLAEEPVWDLTDAIGDGRVGDALGVLSKVLAAGAPPPVVLGTLAGHFRKLVRVRNGAPVAAAPFVVQKLEKQARRYAPARLLVCLRAIHETDEALKGQGALPPALALERLVLGLSS
jgi:DNA polymerase-3 subunit delta